jgi:hypothetical protein
VNDSFSGNLVNEMNRFFEGGLHIIFISICQCCLKFFDGGLHGRLLRSVAQGTNLGDPCPFFRGPDICHFSSPPCTIK